MLNIKQCFLKEGNAFNTFVMFQGLCVYKKVHRAPYTGRILTTESTARLFYW